MSALEKLVLAVLAAVILLLIGWFVLDDYGATRYQAGYADAVALGQKQRDDQAANYRKTEIALRADLAARDLAAFQKEQAYASSLEAAQRRVRAGVDSLRCPAGPVPAAGSAGDRPAAGGPAPDGQGAELVPDVSAALLGDGAASAGLVRKFDSLEQRFEACREVNAR
jgi:hypothetical protein